MRTHIAAGSVTTLLALLLAGPALAEIYKWTDEDGNVVFSEKPPVGQETEIVKPRDTQPAGGSPAATRAARRNVGYDPDEPAELSPEQLARKQQNCDAARSNLTQMTSARANRLQYVNENDELAFLTEEQRTDRTQEAQAKVDEFCD